MQVDPTHWNKAILVVIEEDEDPIKGEELFLFVNLFRFPIRIYSTLFLIHPLLLFLSLEVEMLSNGKIITIPGMGGWVYFWFVQTVILFLLLNFSPFVFVYLLLLVPDKSFLEVRIFHDILRNFIDYWDYLAIPYLLLLMLHLQLLLTNFWFLIQFVENILLFFFVHYFLVYVRLKRTLLKDFFIIALPLFLYLLTTAFTSILDYPSIQFLHYHLRVTIYFWLVCALT